MGGKRQHTLRRMSQLAAEDPQAPLKGSSLHAHQQTAVAMSEQSKYCSHMTLQA